MIDVALLAGRLVLLALLYLFLFAAVRAGIGLVSGQRSAGVGSFTLSVVQGPPELRGVKVPVNGPVVIGRSPGADIVIGDDFVSGKHARVSLAGNEAVLEDLGSTNGTVLNGRAISTPQTPAPRRHDRRRRRAAQGRPRMSGRAKQPWAAVTDIGRVRTHNEDSVLAQPPLFVVADGLGGHEAGEVASSIAVETLRDHAPRRADASALARAVRAANREVIRAAKEGVGRSGMGTTLTAAIVEGGTIAIAHVGDSRAYLLTSGSLRRLSDDHSMVADMIRRGQLTEADARVHPNRSVITRALGTDSNMVADTYEIDANTGDRLLLCSDGLTGMLEDSRIAELLGGYSRSRDRGGRAGRGGQRGRRARQHQRDRGRHRGECEDGLRRPRSRPQPAWLDRRGPVGPRGGGHRGRGGLRRVPIRHHARVRGHRERRRHGLPGRTR